MIKKSHKTIRHPKKIPTEIVEKDKITLFKLLNCNKKEVKIFQRILKKLYVNKNFEKIIHIKKVLDEKDYENLQWMIFYLSWIGFRFIDIEYLLLKTISKKRLSKWANEYLIEPLEQTPVQLILYEQVELKKHAEEYIEKMKLKYPVEKKQTQRWQDIIDSIFSHKIAIVDLATSKVLTHNEFIILAPTKESRKK